MTLLRTVTLAAAGLALVSAVGAILAGFGTRSGWWDFRAGFRLLTWAAYGGLAAAFVSLAALVVAVSWSQARAVFSSFGPAFIGLAVGLAVAGIPWQLKQTAQRVPPIHDITTDTEHPPVFVAVLPVRKYAPNPSTYGGPDIAAQQKMAYPDIRSLTLALPHEEAFKIALATATEMGWEIVKADATEGTIEATDTTFWFGFKDDVVVRVKKADRGARIDVRSVSRVGKSDIGTNAKRIRTFLERIARTRPAL